MIPHGVFFFAAFWTALLTYRGTESVRYVAALAMGAVSARLGWAALYLGEVVAEPRALLGTSGFSVLFVPLGLLVSCRAADRVESFRSLALAFAAARLGCLVFGCCGGVETGWGWLDRYPTQAVEALGLVALACWTRRSRTSAVMPRFFVGFGVVRLLVEPFRSEPLLAASLAAPLVSPPGVPTVSAANLALAWIAFGIGWSLAAHRCPRALWASRSEAIPGRS